VAADDAVARLDAQRVLVRLLLIKTGHFLPGGRVRVGRVPGEGQAVVVVAVVRVALPVAREAGGVRGLLEAAVAEQLGVQPALDALVHVLQELAVEQGADAPLRARGVNADARAGRLRRGLCRDQTEQQRGQ
jgi:hypothetical protein